MPKKIGLQAPKLLLTTEVMRIESALDRQGKGNFMASYWKKLRITREQYLKAIKILEDSR